MKHRLRGPVVLPHGRFRRHYELFEMTYEGPPLPEDDRFAFLPYKGSLYMQLNRLEATAFLPMRQQLDRRPHYMGPSGPDLWFHSRNKEHIMLCYSGKQLVGAGYALPRERTVSGLVTSPDFRRQGAARAILHRCVNHLLAAGDGPITLTVVTINHAAIALYQSAGFRITGLRRYFREEE